MDFYQIPAGSLSEGGRLPIRVLGETGEVFLDMALTMVECIEENQKKGEKTVFIVPVGPVGQYPVFVRLVNEKKLSLKDVWFINMDEYMEDPENLISEDDPLSFRGFMKKTVYDRIDPSLVMPEEQRVFPNPKDTGAILRLIEKLGKVDIAFGGIGLTGHLAFNEPEDVPVAEFRERPTRVLRISEVTRATNSIADLGGAYMVMPKYAVTIGMKEILSARKVRVYCFREWHRGVIREAAFGAVRSLFPASLLQEHKDAVLTVNSIASGQPYEAPFDRKELL